MLPILVGRDLHALPFEHRSLHVKDLSKILYVNISIFNLMRYIHTNYKDIGYWMSANLKMYVDV